MYMPPQLSGHIPLSSRPSAGWQTIGLPCVSHVIGHKPHHFVVGVQRRGYMCPQLIWKQLPPCCMLAMGAGGLHLTSPVHEWRHRCASVLYRQSQAAAQCWLREILRLSESRLLQVRQCCNPHACNVASVTTSAGEPRGLLQNLLSACCCVAPHTNNLEVSVCGRLQMLVTCWVSLSTSRPDPALCMHEFHHWGDSGCEACSIAGQILLDRPCHLHQGVPKTKRKHALLAILTTPSKLGPRSHAHASLGLSTHVV